MEKDILTVFAVAITTLSSTKNNKIGKYVIVFLVLSVLLMVLLLSPQRSTEWKYLFSKIQNE